MVKSPVRCAKVTVQKICFGMTYFLCESAKEIRLTDKVSENIHPQQSRCLKGREHERKRETDNKAEEKMTRRLWAAVVPWAADEEICNLRVGKKDQRPCQAPFRDHTRLKRVGQSAVLLSSACIFASLFLFQAIPSSLSGLLADAARPQSQSPIRGTSAQGQRKRHYLGKDAQSHLVWSSTVATHIDLTFGHAEGSCC